MLLADLLHDLRRLLGIPLHDAAIQEDYQIVTAALIQPLEHLRHALFPGKRRVCLKAYPIEILLGDLHREVLAIDDEERGALAVAELVLGVSLELG